MGYIAALILVVTLLPLLGMLYMDVLQTKKEAQIQIEKMEKLRREVQNEKQQREKDK
jgi:cell division protein FtsB